MRSHRRAFAGFVPPVCLAAFTVSSGWWREILWRSLRPTAAMQKIYNTLLLCLNSFTSHLRLASDVMLIFNCHHLDWHCFGNLFVLVWKGHGCISLEKIYECGMKRVCLDKNLLRNKTKRQHLGWRDAWCKRADGREPGQWYFRIQRINTLGQAAAAHFLSWGFPKTGCEKSQRLVGADHLVLVILEKHKREMVCLHWNSAQPVFSIYSQGKDFPNSCGEQKRKRGT